MSSKSSPSTSREQTPEPAAESSKRAEEKSSEDRTSEEQDSTKPETTTEDEGTTEPTKEPTEPPSHGWQAIFSPQHNAYYFFNSITQETTWINPLQPEASSSTQAPAPETPSASKSPEPEASKEPSPSSAAGPSSTSTATSHYAALQAAAAAQGIDPALAHLDPSLLSAVPGVQTDASGIPLFTAKFNRHSGAFARPDARDPSHLSEHERAKRMSQFYFDVDKWQEDLAKHGGSIKGAAADEWEDDGQGGKKRKRPTKKDLEMYKEKKKQKKLAKTAWLRQ